VSDGAPTGLGVRAAFAVAATGIEKLVALGIALYLPRHLDLADYGRYAFVLACANFFQVLPDASLEAVLVARLAAADRDVPRLAGQGAAVRLVVALVGAALALGFLALALRGRGMLAPAAVYACALVFLAASPYKALLRGQLRMQRYLGLLAGQAAVAVTLVVAAIVSGGGLVAVLGGIAVGALAAVLLGRVLAGPGARPRFDPALGRALVVAAWPLAAGTLLLAGAQQVLYVLLLRTHGEDAMGLLGGATKVVEAVGLLPSALMVTMLPALSRAERDTSGLATARAADAARLLAVALVPPCALLACWPEAALTTILGPRLAPAAPVLRIVVALVPLGATGAVLSNLLIAAGMQRVLLVGTATGAAAMVALGAALVPRAGAGGAATATVVAMLTGQCMLLVLPSTRVRATAVLGAALPPVAVGALAAALGSWAAAPASGVLVLVAVYAAGLVATGMLSRAQLARWWQ